MNAAVCIQAPRGGKLGLVGRRLPLARTRTAGRRVLEAYVCGYPFSMAGSSGRPVGWLCRRRVAVAA